MTGFFDHQLPDGSRYVVFVPKGVEPPYPTIVSLHGRGESGTDGLLQLAIGLGQAVLRRRANWPYLIVFPQKPTQADLWPASLSMLSEVLKEVEAKYATDPHRRYLTGLSQGGHGTLSLVNKLPWQFAAAASVCGWSTDLSSVGRAFAGIPVRLYHGLKDDVILPERSREVNSEIMKAGGEVELIEFPNANHNAWDPAYQESDLGTWFLRHTLGS